MKIIALNMMTLYLHIGLHKTATTFLQKAVFPNIRDINFIEQERIYRILRRIMIEDSVIFDQNKTKKQISNYMTDGINLISAEGLSGNPCLQYINRSNVVYKLHNMFSDAKIIIGIRNQRDMIVSLYKQYVKIGGTKRISDFIHPKQIIGEPIQDFFDLETLKYGPYLQRIEEYFGLDNIYIYIYEDLLRDKKKFVKGILNFLGVRNIPYLDDRKYNAGFTDSELSVALFLNRFFRSSRNESSIFGRPRGFWKLIRILGKLVPQCMSVHTYDEVSSLHKFFISDNNSINKRYNLCLEKYHYDKYFQ